MRLKSIIVFSLFTMLSFSAFGSSVQKFILNTGGNDRFPLVASGNPVCMVEDSTDFPGVLRAVNNLRNDINNVTGFVPFLSKNKLPKEKQLLIIGTLGKNTFINQLVKSGKIDAAELSGKNEKYLIQTIAHPFQGVDEALVIAGSDKRGTIYGVYELSAQIGVSPWYYWADVPVKKQKDIYVIRGKYTDGEPVVKYRGIFLNDEAPALSGWSKDTFGGFNHKFYEKVFELVLRLKGNYMWPAMWGNAFYDDDSVSGPLANEMGIVVGTSHHEPMGLAQQDWKRRGTGAWDYTKNGAVLRDFWRTGIERCKDWESVITVGMRGDGDEPMTENANIELLQNIVKDQRRIITEVTKRNAEETPQMWALYKEVQEYYDKGMRVPDDVTLLLCDDNWGNVRKLPDLGAPYRKGGYGMYYHVDYVGGPRNYKWLNVSQIQRIWEQMNLTYRYGVDKIWILNVGDLKPMEYPISFFLDMAWNPDQFSANNLIEHTEKWCAQQFGDTYAKDAARMIDLYTKYNRRVTPELLNAGTYSTVNYREFDGVVKDYKQLENEATELYNRLPSDTRDVFDQLVLFPIQACANLNEMYAAQALNQLYAAQGRISANDWAMKVKQLYERDSLLTIHYNKEIAGGKWNHMMDQTHIGYTYWQQPEKNVMPKVSFVTAPKDADMRIAVEGFKNVAALNKAEISLPAFDSFAKQQYYIDLFNAGETPFKYTLKASNNWLIISDYKGINKNDRPINKNDRRINISIDWNKLSVGKHEGKIVVKTKGRSITIKVKANSLQTPENLKHRTFMESNGCVSIEAEHYSAANNNDKVSWQIIPGLGKTLSGITTSPVTATPQEDAANGVSLEYDVYLQSSGDATLKLLLSPTLNFNGNKGLRYAVSIDGGEEQIVNFNQKFTEREREHWVANSIIESITKHHFSSAGLHTIKYRAIEPGIILQKILLDMGGLKPSYLGAPESPFLNKVK
ncbi:glycosyl hydrolase 115 family protein [uncultured Bacteroides sp.]|uniref:glycosyl hydrolase 115 family protein n=1 Tax=uncultured Bacteroides sp. TaxID=162156 RepID=UPI002AABB7ED|nr:glycosyl hydrolase 115 family protein [uncultured Bacteroides sp.]